MSANLYTVPNKATGQTWTAAEHNLLKAVHNLVATQVCNVETAITILQGQVPAPGQLAAINSALAALQVDQTAQDTAISLNAANFASSLAATPEW